MSWKKLENFVEVFNREDFSYIADKKNIFRVTNIFVNNLTRPDGLGQQHIIHLDEYEKQLRSFHKWCKFGFVHKFNEGFTECVDSLASTKNILGEEHEKRTTVSSNRGKQLKRQFLRGLNKILHGIRTVFAEDLLSETNITREQIINFLLSKKEGLGKKYRFNKHGKHAFMNKVNLLDKGEILVVRRLLQNPGNQARRYNGWFDLGIKRTPVRILVEQRKIVRDRVCFLFSVKEHDEYQHYVIKKPSNFRTSY